ncbi:MAG: hypothetical protein MJ231_05975 [bacterium]|nr:hypothetical protein [bacterium]
MFYGELSRIKIQLDIKNFEAFKRSLHLVELLSERGIRVGDKFGKLDPKRVEFCGTSGYDNMVTQGYTFDYDEPDQHRYVRDVIRSLSDKGCIFCVNYAEIKGGLSGDPIND